MISQYFMLSSAAPFRRTAWLSFTAFSVRARRRFSQSADRLDDFKDRAAKVLLERQTPNYIAALEQINDLFEEKHFPLEWDEEKGTSTSWTRTSIFSSERK